MSQFGELTKEYIVALRELTHANMSARRAIAKFTKSFCRRLTVYDLFTLAIDNLREPGTPWFEPLNCRCVIVPLCEENTNEPISY